MRLFSHLKFRITNISKTVYTYLSGHFTEKYSSSKSNFSAFIFPSSIGKGLIMFPTAYFKWSKEFRPCFFLSPWTEGLSSERIGRCKKTFMGLWKEGNEVMINCTHTKTTGVFILAAKKATLLCLQNMSSAWLNKVSYFSENSFFGNQRVGLGALLVSDAKQQAKRVSASKEAANMFHTFCTSLLPALSARATNAG